MEEANKAYTRTANFTTSDRDPLTQEESNSAMPDPSSEARKRSQSSARRAGSATKVVFCGQAFLSYAPPDFAGPGSYTKSYAIVPPEALARLFTGAQVRPICTMHAFTCCVRCKLFLPGICLERPSGRAWKW
eukprot:6182318-Pleurochrysis_carterae.AAC.2